MAIWDKDDLLKKKKEKDKFLKENFEDPEHSDILIEKQVKEGKRKR